MTMYLILQDIYNITGFPSAKCKEPIVGYREQRENEWIPLNSDTEGLILLTKV